MWYYYKISCCTNLQCWLASEKRVIWVNEEVNVNYELGKNTREKQKKELFKVKEGGDRTILMREVSCLCQSWKKYKAVKYVEKLQFIIL